MINQLINLSLDNFLPFAKDLIVPKNCHIKIQDINDIDPILYRETLLKHGLMIIDVNFDDVDKYTLRKIIESIGIPHIHDNSNIIEWTIRSGAGNIARSHGSEDFYFHTDCSYEQKTPDYFGLYVIEHDNNGGGINLFISSAVLIQALSSKSRNILQTREYKIKVPPEFYQGIDYIYATLLDENFNLRFRADIIETSDMDHDQLSALSELISVINTPQNCCVAKLPKHKILLLCNKRFLHARTKVLDANRHLKRIRFDLIPH